MKDILTCREIEVEPRQTKNSDYILESDLSRIEKHKLDLVLRLGFRILRGRILKIFKYGVWSYHHGDTQKNIGGPAGLWEIFNQVPITCVTLQLLNEKLDNGVILAQSFSATDKISLYRNRQKYFWKSSSIIPTALSQFHLEGESWINNKINQSNHGITVYSQQLFKVPNNLQTLKYVFLIYCKKLLSKILNFFNNEKWIILIRFAKGKVFSNKLYQFTPLVPPRDRFWADPFIVYNKDRYFVFIEEFLYKKNKGHISCLEISPQYNVISNKAVLEEDTHLSYPFIIKDEGNYYMIPESAQDNCIKLYKAEIFPNKWTLFKILMKNVYAVDTTILKKDGLYWLFTSIKSHECNSANDTLSLFYSKTLVTDNWTPHPKNPIVNDVRNSRSAGNIFEHDNNLYRPSQNCSIRYGYSVKLNEIVVLSKTNYEEKEVDHIQPNWSKNIETIHTFNFNNSLTVIDGVRKSFYFK